MRSLYRTIMDSEANPLKDLPAAQRFQIMLFLSVMWTVIFCTAAGAWMWSGELLLLHLLVAAGFTLTGLTFRAAKRTGTYRDQPVADGTARYDDVWGG